MHLEELLKQLPCREPSSLHTGSWQRGVFSLRQKRAEQIAIVWYSMSSSAAFSTCMPSFKTSIRVMKPPCTLAKRSLRCCASESCFSCVSRRWAAFWAAWGTSPDLLVAWLQRNLYWYERSWRFKASHSASAVQKQSCACSRVTLVRGHCIPHWWLSVWWERH
jgi:hypothetical protein